MSAAAAAPFLDSIELKFSTPVKDTDEKIENSTSAAGSVTSKAAGHTSAFGRNRTQRQCVLGVCAMDKKVHSKPMIQVKSRLTADLTARLQILDRLRAYGEFDIIVFGNELILNDDIPVSAWPICDCLISCALPVQELTVS